MSESKCVSFDIDDTLYLERDYVRSGFKAVDSWIRDVYDTQSFFDVAWRYFETGRRGDIFNVALEAVGITPAYELILKLLSIYRGHDPAILLLPDADACIQRISGTRFVGIISDGALVGQQMKVKRLGLASRCNHIILTEGLGVEYCKPDPRSFLMMQQISGCAPETCIYIADNPRKDFISPNRLGWRTVRVRRPGGLYASVSAAGDSQAAFEIETLSELPALLEHTPLADDRVRT